MPNIEIRNLLVSYDPDTKHPVIALDHFSAVFMSGKISVVLGESGCGKTTLLQTIAGLLDYDGEILVNGIDYSTVPFEKRSLAYVKQDFVLYPRLTIYDNIVFPLDHKKMSRQEMDERVKTLACEFNIYHCLTRLPKHLSIGQCQRAALAKALVRYPDVVLCDEPLSACDPITANEIQQYLKDFVAKHGTTMVYVTHDIKHALSFADEVFVMNKGKLLDHNTADKIKFSKNVLVQELLAKGTLS